MKDVKDVDELLEEYDQESSGSRKLVGLIGIIATIIAIGMSVFHLYTAGRGTLLSLRQRSLHIIFAFTLGFLLFPATKKGNKKKPSILDYVFIGLSLLIFGYLFIFVEEIALKGGNMTTMDILFGATAILLTLEITRRVVGPELPIVAIIFLLYARFGPYFPGELGHRGYSWSRIIGHMYFTLEGLLGIPIGVSATFVFMFLLFGAFLDKTGVGEFFINLAYSL
ncbi:MAG TPA: TRAP transporter large permease subunit, partial [Tissierellales bacterium]|nr:TRAP transporter large permease subunit [Tissierellales bacterium]